MAQTLLNDLVSPYGDNLGIEKLTPERVVALSGVRDRFSLNRLVVDLHVFFVEWHLLRPSLSLSRYPSTPRPRSPPAP